MSRYDSTSPIISQPEERPTPFVAVALLAAAGLALALLVGLLAVGVKWETTWRVSAVVFAMAVLVASGGAFRRVWSYSMGALEKAVRIDLNGDGRLGQDIRLVPVRSPGGRLDGMDVEDLKYMISRLDADYQRGWTVREWLYERLPSGREIVGTDVGPYADFIQVLEKCGALVDRTERNKGRLVMTREQVMKAIGI